MSAQQYQHGDTEADEVGASRRLLRCPSGTSDTSEQAVEVARVQVGQT